MPPLSAIVRMVLYLVLLLLMLAISLASLEKCASSVSSRMDLSVHGQKNATGHWIITVDTRRQTSTEDRWVLNVNMNVERSCDGTAVDQLVTVTSVFPPLDDSSMPGGIQPVTPSTTSITPSSTTTTTTPSTTRSPTSCPREGYQLFAGFNCYKGFPNVRKTWSDARKVCNGDGGDLAVAETDEEKEKVFIPLHKRLSFYSDPWVGVYVPLGSGSWITVKDEPVPSTWWKPGRPYDGPAAKCAWADSSGLLYNGVCSDDWPFVCEMTPV